MLSTLLIHFPQTRTDSARELWYHLYDKLWANTELGIEKKLSWIDSFFFDKFWIMLDSNMSDVLKNSGLELVYSEGPGMSGFFGLLGQKYTLPRLRETRRPVRSHFQRYVGVGYKDKGGSSKPAYDGSPSWQNISGQSKITNIGFEHRLKVLLKNKERLQKDPIRVTFYSDQRTGLFEKNRKIICEFWKIFLPENPNNYALELIEEGKNSRVTDPILNGETVRITESLHSEIYAHSEIRGWYKENFFIPYRIKKKKSKKQKE
jgi:hypothetical protein